MRYTHGLTFMAGAVIGKALGVIGTLYSIQQHMQRELDNTFGKNRKNLKST